MEETLFRWMLASVVALNVGISARYRGRARAVEAIPRDREGRGLRLGRAAVAVPLLVSILLFLFAPATVRWTTVDLDRGWRWLGVTLGLASAVLVWRVLEALGPNVSETIFTKSSHELVTEGPYARVRHPLYSAGFLLVAGVALISASALVALLLAISVVLIRVVIVPREEVELVAAFGDRYRDYRARTGVFLPRLGAQRGTGSKSSPASSRRG